MKKPDPARFMGRQKSKVDDLEMKGFSNTSSISPENDQKTSQVETNRRTEERKVVRSNERTTEYEKDRVKIRHTFDIYDDQLGMLHQIQLEAVQAGGKKPKLGDMVQEALSDYFKKRKIHRDNERTDERPTERSDDQI